MPDAGDLAPTASYAGGWLILAIVLLVATVAWNGAVLVWGRPRRVRRTATVRRDPVRMRAEYLHRIDLLDAAHLSRQVDAREAHRELSATCRSFVEELTGLPARSMTLAGLRAGEVTGLVELVERAYPAEFGRDAHVSDDDWRTAVALARTVVTGPWS